MSAHSWAIRIEFAIVEQQSSGQDLSPDFDHYVVKVPTRHAPRVPAGFPARSTSRQSTEPAVVVEQPSSPRDVPTDYDRHIVLFPTRYAAYAPPDFPAQPAGRPAFGVLPTADGGQVVWAER